MPELIDAISSAAEKTKTWDEYRGIFLTPKRIAAGVVFAKQHKDLINRVGKETWVLVSDPPFWLWMLERNDSPWYRTVKLFRKRSFRGWVSLIGKICDDLSVKLDLKKH